MQHVTTPSTCYTVLLCFEQRASGNRAALQAAPHIAPRRWMRTESRAREPAGAGESSTSECEKCRRPGHIRMRNSAPTSPLPGARCVAAPGASPAGGSGGGWAAEPAVRLSIGTPAMPSSSCLSKTQRLLRLIHLSSTHRQQRKGGTLLDCLSSNGGGNDYAVEMAKRSSASMLGLSGKAGLYNVIGLTRAGDNEAAPRR